MNKENHLFAVVDVETTGGKPTDTKITEIAVVISDGKTILEEFSTLVNPNRRIDWYVSKLTGITDEMVAEAPAFSESLDKIKQLLDGKIFVAHNVDFDYNIIKREFLELGKPLDNQKLCTVKSARKVFQHLSSYSLGNLAEHLNIALPNAHRALDDTRATTELLHKILEQADFDFLYSEIKHQNHIIDLPAHWVIRDEKSIDNNSGLVYFHDNDSNIIYIDYTNNFQKKIYNLIDHATKKDPLSSRIVSLTSTITLDYISDLFKAEMKMMNDIQIHKPKYNKPFKGQSDLFCVTLKQDEKNLYYLSISRAKHTSEVHGPVIYSASFRNAEKLKDKFMHSPEIAQLAVLKKQIYVDDGLMKEIHIKQYNDTFLGKLHREYFCPIKNGYYIFNIYGDNEVDAIQVKDYYLKAWGQGIINGNKVHDFRSEFDFDENQKITRKFLNILPKTSYKLVSEDDDSSIH